MDRKRIDEIHEARAQAYDAARPDVVASRHAGGFLTARERINALLDPGSAVEYGVLSGRRTEGGWVHTTGGVDCAGTVDGQPVVTSSTDYTDHGGGYGGGRLTRLFAIAHEHRWPVVLFVDGGGSRATYPARSGGPVIGFGTPVGRFSLFDGVAELSGWVPTMAVISGPSFAGHASLAAFCDLLVATRGSSIGMGGPPMVEAALGLRLTHQELGPVESQDRLGGIDLLVDNEPAATAAVRRYLSYYRDIDAGTPAPEADAIGSLVPEEGPYDMRPVIEALCDAGTFFELRAGFAPSLITGLARMGGRTVGVLANQPLSANGGAIDQHAADKISRFVEICDAYEYPILALVDTPGFVVDPGDGSPPQPGMTRHHSRALLAHHHRTVPAYGVQIRRGHGLGGFAMTGLGEGRCVPPLRLAWPTVELGAQDGFAPSVRERNSFDDVIDPAETRDYVIGVLRMTKRTLDRKTKKHPVDSW